MFHPQYGIRSMEIKKKSDQQVYSEFKDKGNVQNCCPRHIPKIYVMSWFGVPNFLQNKLMCERSDIQ